MEELTRRQRQILDYIKEMLSLNGMPPTIAEIAEAMEVSSTNGIRGHLQALERKGAISLIPGASRGIQLLEIDEQQGLPIIGRVAAGSPILAEEHVEDYCQVDNNLFHPSADYLLRVHGESMRDVGILDGDLLAVHRTPVARNGQIIVARVDDSVTVKRLQKKGNTIYLKAENADFEPIKINLKKQSLDIEGIVVGIFRTY
ncbi:MAG: transcriptional repressor LexA [Thiohalomonadales bacterium]